MVLASPGPLLTPPPSSSPPKTPFRFSCSRGERERWLLATLLAVVLRHVATQDRGLINHGHLLSVMKHVYIMHTFRRQISQHLLMQQPLVHHVLCDLTLCRYRRTSSNFDIVHILQNTQRSKKVKWRKGKKVSTVDIVSLCRISSLRSSINQRWSRCV
jgi:hypothetical protein